MKYFYEKDMLRLEGISGDHTISDIDIYIGTDVLEKAAQYIQKRNLGNQCLIVADNNTYRAAGKKLAHILSGSGMIPEICLLRDRKEESIEADELSTGQVMMSLEPKPDFLVACGSGVINDVTRFVSQITGIPFVSVGTAASMDGYTSVTAPMIYNRKKVHRHGSAPKVLILDTTILRNAPKEMIIAGFGDVYGKNIAKADWLISNLINGEPVDTQALNMITQALQKLSDNVDEIAMATDKGLKAIIEGLILAGITIFTTGQTRAVASVEHNQSHIWETRMLEAGMPYPSHGTAVGCSTGYYLRMYEYFRKIDISQLNREKAREKLFDGNRFRSQAMQCFGEDFLKELEKKNQCLQLSYTVFNKQYDTIMENWNEALKLLTFLPSWETYRKIYNQFDQTIHSEEMGIPVDLLRYTLPYATFYRDRYDFVYVMNILGVVEDIVDKTLRDYQKQKIA